MKMKKCDHTNNFKSDNNQKELSYNGIIPGPDSGDRGSTPRSSIFLFFFNYQQNSLMKLLLLGIFYE